MDTGTVLGVAGVALTIGLGVGALLQGRRSNARITQELASLRRVIIRGRPGSGDAGRVDLAAVDYADVDNDSQTELVIQHAAGVHGTVLSVMGWDEVHEFRTLAQLGTGTPAGFTIGDLDGDGAVEVATIDVDWDREVEPGRTASYAEGARVELLYRWQGGSFQEIARRVLPLPGGADTPLIWHTDPLGVE